MDLLLYGVIVVWLAIMVYGSYSIAHSFYLKSLCHIHGATDTICLTFDDVLLNAQQTEKVLDVLKKYEVKAIFFVVGKYIEGNEKMLQRIYEEGHTIGNHSFEHHARLTCCSSLKVERDLLKWETAMSSLNLPLNKLYRPPYGVTNPSIAKAVKKLNYRSIGWNIRSLDTQYKQYERCFKRIIRQIRGKDIVLLHDHLSFSHVLLEELLLYCRKKRLKIIDPKVLV